MISGCGAGRRKGPEASRNERRPVGLQWGPGWGEEKMRQGLGEPVAGSQRSLQVLERLV